MKEYCFGIDVGGTSVKLGLFKQDGELMDKWEIPTRKEDKGEHILADIADAVRGKLQERGISAGEVLGIGLGVPGPTMEDGYVSSCVNLGWEAKNPAKELGSMLSLTVKAGNDANVAALGEMWKGGGEGYSDVVMLTLGTGVGGGVILKGEMIVGRRGLGGELGHITVNTNETVRCNCGNYGCLEQYASATGVVRVARKLLEQGGQASVLRNIPDFTAKDVFDAARNADTVALSAVDTLGRYLGQVMAAVTQTIDPDVFVIGGGVSRAGKILTEVIERYYRRYTVIAGENRAQIVLARLGNDAGIYGAARMVLD